jgi:hypothetical protein
MKKLTVACIIVLVLTATAYAQMGGMGGMGTTGGSQAQTGQGMQMQCPKMGGQMQGMQGGMMPGMQGMQGGMQMQQCGMTGMDMIQTMMDIMDNQEKIMMGLRPAEKEAMALKIKQMKEKMQGLMTICKGNMMGTMGQQPPVAVPAPESMEKEPPAKTESK